MEFYLGKMAASGKTKEFVMPNTTSLTIDEIDTVDWLPADIEITRCIREACKNTGT